MVWRKDWIFLSGPQQTFRRVQSYDGGSHIHGRRLAGAEAWRRVHPDQVHAYAAQRAVEVILAAKASLRIKDA
jgi:hypothetical protein